MNTIASFFAGIMTFVSSLLGYSSHQSIVTVTTPIVEQVAITQEAMQVGTSTATSTFLVKDQVASTSGTLTNTNETLSTFSVNIYDTTLSFKYPKEWNLVKNSDGSVAVYDEPTGKARAITKIYFFSSSEDFLNISKVRFGKIATHKADPLFSDRYHGPNTKHGDSIVYNNDGVCFQTYEIQYNSPENNYSYVVFSDYSNSCTLSTRAIQQILDTISFKESGISLKEKKSINPLLFFNEKLDYRGQTFYVNKNKSKVYFYEYTRGEEWGYDETNIKYFETQTESEHDTPFVWRMAVVGYSGTQSKMYPYLIQDLRKEYNSIDIIDLDKEREFTAYWVKDQGESLIAKCIEYGNYDAVGIFPDIEYLDNFRLRVGIYKNVGQDKKECTKETLGKYEKIRDDFVDLNKL